MGTSVMTLAAGTYMLQVLMREHVDLPTGVLQQKHLTV